MRPGDRAPGVESELIEPLDPSRHDRASFSCGKAQLDRFLREQADQERRRGVSQTYVLARGDRILGYYSLAATAIDLSLVPPEIGRKLPRYPLLPAILLARLAIDASCAGRGRGEYLLIDALKVSLETSNRVGAIFVVVDAIDSDAAGFYAHMGFRAFADRPLKLFLRMSDAKAAIEASGRGRSLAPLAPFPSTQSMSKPTPVASSAAVHSRSTLIQPRLRKATPAHS